MAVGAGVAVVLVDGVVVGVVDRVVVEGVVVDVGPDGVAVPVGVLVPVAGAVAVAEVEPVGPGPGVPAQPPSSASPRTIPAVVAARSRVLHMTPPGALTIQRQCTRLRVAPVGPLVRASGRLGPAVSRCSGGGDMPRRGRPFPTRQGSWLPIRVRGTLTCVAHGQWEAWKVIRLPHDGA